MTKKSGKRIYQFLGFMAVISLFITACGGGGGTSSGSGGGGGGISVARFAGTISAGNSTAGLDIEQRVFDSTGAIVAIGNFIMPAAQAQITSVDGIEVVVTCSTVGTSTTPSVPVALPNDGIGVTDAFGKFDIPIVVDAPANCSAIFGNDELVVAFSINPGTQTEVEVDLLADGTLELKRVRQEGGDGGISIEVDEDSDDDCSDDDSSSSDDDSSSSSDDDSSSSDDDCVVTTTQ